MGFQFRALVLYHLSKLVFYNYYPLALECEHVFHVLEQDAVLSADEQINMMDMSVSSVTSLI